MCMIHALPRNVTHRKEASRLRDSDQAPVHAADNSSRLVSPATAEARNGLFPQATDTRT